MRIADHKLRRRLGSVLPAGGRRRRRALAAECAERLTGLGYSELHRRYGAGEQTTEVVRGDRGEPYELEVLGDRDEIVGTQLRIVVTVINLPDRRHRASDGFVMDETGAVVARLAVMWCYDSERRARRRQPQEIQA